MFACGKVVHMTFGKHEGTSYDAPFLIKRILLTGPLELFACFKQYHGMYFLDLHASMDAHIPMLMFHLSWDAHVSFANATSRYQHINSECLYSSSCFFFNAGFSPCLVREHGCQ